MHIESEAEQTALYFVNGKDKTTYTLDADSAYTPVNLSKMGRLSRRILRAYLETIIEIIKEVEADYDGA